MILLYRSVIEKAEKALALKQPQPISVASSIKPSSNLASRLEKSPPPKRRSPEGKPRRVYVENESSKKTDEDSRKVLSKDRSMQITVSSDVKSKSKSKDSKKEVKDLRESLMERRRASTRSSTEEWEQSRSKGVSQDDRLANYSREKDWDYIADDRNGDGWLSKKGKVSSKASKSRGDNGEERRSASKEKIVEKGRKSKEDKESPRRSRKDEEREGKNVKKASKSQEQKEDRKKKDDTGSNRDSMVKVTEKAEQRETSEGEKAPGTKHQARTDSRKESLFDESAFVPDYNETMGSESEEEVSKQEIQRQYSTAESEKVESESEEETSGEEREKKHKKKKSKHKKNKKKHKKHKKKHKKQDEEESS